MGDPAEFEYTPNEKLWAEASSRFEIGDYFEVHELLEELWRRHDGDLSDFYQGLLQAAVSLYHYGNGNFHGAKLLARQCDVKLKKLPEHFHGIDLGRFKREYAAVMAPVLEERPGLKPLDCADAPSCTHHPMPEANMANDDNTALHRAIREGNLDEIQQLVGVGHYLNSKDDAGNTPLHVAVDCGDIAAIKLLLAHKAQFALRNDAGQTALQLAVAESKDAIVKALLSGCDNPVHATNYPDAAGWTAVHLAAARCDLPILEMLLDAGGSATKLTPTGETPGALCRKDEFKTGGAAHCIELLRAHGAQR